jgi:small conductance mechanosensitive channel
MSLQIQTLEPTFNTLNFVKELAITYTPKLAGAIVVYLIGSVLIGWVSKLIQKTMNVKKVDVSLQSFLSSFVKVLLNILLLLTVFGMLGVNLTSFAAILAGLAVGVGAALNGTLGNFSGGVMMLLFKPFKVGDLIEAQGNTGTVLEQGIFNTTLLSAENKTIILANGAVSTGTIINYTTHGSLRVDINMAIGVEQSVDQARQVALEAMKSVPNILQNPKPEINILKIGDGMTMLAIRPYCVQSEYWNVFFGVQEVVKNAWDTHGIQGPIPHNVFITK